MGGLALTGTRYMTVKDNLASRQLHEILHVHHTHNGEQIHVGGICTQTCFCTQKPCAPPYPGAIIISMHDWYSVNANIYLDSLIGQQCSCLEHGTTTNNISSGIPSSSSNHMYTSCTCTPILTTCMYIQYNCCSYPYIATTGIAMVHSTSQISRTQLIQSISTRSQRHSTMWIGILLSRVNSLTCA